MQCLKGFLDRCAVVPAMNLVQVNVIDPQPPKAVVDSGVDRLSGQSCTIRSLAPRCVYLGCDHHLVTPGEVLQRTSEYFLATARRVLIGGVEEVDSQLDCATQEW